MGETTTTRRLHAAALVLVMVAALAFGMFAAAAVAPDAHAASKGWNVTSGKLFYVGKDGKRVKSQKVDGITLGSDGYAKSNTASQLKMLCMQRIKSWTSSGQSKYSKLQTCFSHCVSMAFVPSTTPKDIGTSGWVQRCALRTLRTYNTECFGCACSFAMLAYELGYEPTVYGYPGVHSYVIIDGKRWDNMASQPKIAGVEHWKHKSCATPDPAGTKTSVFKWGEKYNPGKQGLYKKKGHWYFAKNGKNVKKTWKTVKGKTYYFKANGQAATGPYKAKRGKGAKTWWVFNAKGVLLKGKATRVVKVAGVKYRVAKSGKAKPGWESERTRYFLTNGELACGTRLVKGKLMCFSVKGKYDATSSEAMQLSAVNGEPATELIALLGEPTKTTTDSGTCYELPSNPTLGGVDRTRSYEHLIVSTFVGDDGVEYLESIVSR